MSFFFLLLAGWFTIAADVEALKRSLWESLEYTPVDAELVVIIDRARATTLPILSLRELTLKLAMLIALLSGQRR